MNGPMWDSILDKGYVHNFFSNAAVPNHVSPVATLSMSNFGRFSLTKSRNKPKISSISSLDFWKSSLVTFFVGVMVRLLYRQPIK